MKLRINTLKNWHQRMRIYGLRNTVILIRNLKRDGCFKLSFSGIDFFLRGNSVDFYVFNSIFAKGEYDFEPGFKPEYIVDAGAFTGISALYFHRRYPEAKIIAIEPERSNYDLLVRNTGPYKDIYPLRGGVFGEDKALTISDNDAEKYAFRLEESGTEGEAVPGYTIKTLMNDFQLPRIDILKMDIEGAEYSVFKNDPDAWLCKVKILVTELHEYIYPGVKELVITTVSRLGFRIEWKGENLIATQGNHITTNSYSVEAE